MSIGVGTYCSIRDRLEQCPTAQESTNGPCSGKVYTRLDDSRYVTPCVVQFGTRKLPRASNVNIHVGSIRSGGHFSCVIRQDGLARASWVLRRTSHIRDFNLENRCRAKPDTLKANLAPSSKLQARHYMLTTHNIQQGAHTTRPTSSRNPSPTFTSTAN